MKLRFIFSKYITAPNGQRTLCLADTVHDIDNELAKTLVKDGIAEGVKDPDKTNGNSPQ